MAIKLVQALFFALVINVTLPGPDPRKPVRGDFVARYKTFTRQELKDLGLQYEAGQLTDDELLDRVLIDDEPEKEVWAISGIGGESGEYKGDQQREIVYKTLGLARGVIQAFFQEAGGQLGKVSPRWGGR